MAPAINAASKSCSSVNVTSISEKDSTLREQLIKEDRPDASLVAEGKEVEESKGADSEPELEEPSTFSKAGYNEGDISAANYVVARKVVVNHREHIAQKSQEKAAAVAKGELKEPVLCKHYHYIHGKAYDLRPFYNKHPGGKGILEMTAGIIDSTAVFESYHAMANMPSILKQMEAYRVSDEEHTDQGYVLPQSMYAFEQDGFWYTLRKRVRAHFGVHKDAASATKASKANTMWYAKFALFSGLWLSAYLLAITNVFGDNSTPVRVVAALAAGVFFIQWGFSSMHDASHFAVAPRNSWVNQFVTELWCGLALWNGKVWMWHHAVMHHSFTGNERLDPDIHHAMPLVAKHPETGKGWLPPIFQMIGDNFGMFGWGVACMMLYVFLPGMWFGQVIFYALYRLALTKDNANMWGMEPFSGVKGYKTPMFETVLYLAQVAAHLYLGNIYVTYAYVVAKNFTYSMCIVADHDLLESAITNHLDVDAPQDMNGSDFKRQDWGEVQVRNSTNFVNDPMGFFAHCFGSINQQVEHHCFPGINSVHLPAIAPIVQQTCLEFDIPYTSVPDISDAWLSFLLTVRSVMSEKDITEDELQAYKERIEASKITRESVAAGKFKTQ